jgi:3'-5' exoribonuclease
MGRRFVNQLSDQESVDEIYRVNHKQLRPNRNGDLYLQVDLADRTGTISALLWNADDALYRSFDVGEYVRVRGTAQIYNGAMQVLANHVSRARSPDVNEDDFFPLAPKAIDQLARQLTAALRRIANPHLAALAESFLVDEEFMRKFARAPAGIKNHHAYHGGLLEHVVTMLDLADKVAQCYPAIDRDLLTMGVFLHDAGKIDELEYEKAFTYTDEGQLIGHLVIAVGFLEAKLREAEQLSGEPFPKEIELRVKHMIVSHHGEYEYGSPKLPMTLEAIALTYLDNLDAKLHSFQQLIHDDPNVEGNFTTYNQNLRRKLYKGSKD